MFLWFIICYRHKPTLASDGYIKYVDDMFFKLSMKLFIYCYTSVCPPKLGLSNNCSFVPCNVN